MSTVSELFAPRFMNEHRPQEEMFTEMARELVPIRCDICLSIRSREALDRPTDELCRACITGRYPTPHGQKLYQIALANAEAEQLRIPRILARFGPMRSLPRVPKNGTSANPRCIGMIERYNW